MIKVLVITLYCGENEYEQCCKSVNEQEGLIIEHKVIKNLPKQEAHQKLYKLFNDNAEKFDFFAKLDADMAFATPRSLQAIIQKFENGVDIVSATVHDGITNCDMQSFNVFSSKCHFIFDSNDPLFTDRLRKEYPGRQLSYIDSCRNVLHAFNPSPFQAFMFGVHRALKVVQPNVRQPTINNSFHQKKILYQVYRNYLLNKSNHSKYALYGATAVLRGTIKSEALYQKSDYLEVYHSIIKNKSQSIDKNLESKSLFSLIKVIGLVRFVAGGYKLMMQRVKLLRNK